MLLFSLSEWNDTKALFCEEKYYFNNILCDSIIIIIITSHFYGSHSEESVSMYV